ncbi:endonuclease domain-containing protein [Aestuariimicrobium sp. T2.26MG-19.2B]|uniref:endonuclease domain-containing protein n=1 Tax=Aestuariimicrobium sp. T2.26MG-19.2B TaxID=3040679 RepID=UPI002477C6F9|nr:DUF559 domain-containing protein [Aestuariimicrobium sp. T2.26MG-19.2B]CAI9400946.1 hypothetical protein AESSP_00494 [Aestuariimicrobium sp. T2.26MG-19.2B]
MGKHDDEIGHLLRRSHGVIRASSHPHLRAAVTSLVAQGVLVRPAPGLVAAASMLGQLETSLEIVREWQPDAVLLGRAAIAVDWCPELSCEEVSIAISGRPTRTVLGLRVFRAQYPGELVTERHGHLLLTPPAAALWSAARGDWDPLCTTLRRRGDVTPATLMRTAALAPRAEGPGWRAAAARARRNPWSVAEVDLHDFFRAARLIGWEGNPRMVLDGRVVFPDARFVASRTIVEVDSEQHHGGLVARIRDNERRNLFTSHGWKVLNLTPTEITTQPGRAIARIRQLLHQREMLPVRPQERRAPAA